MDAPSRDVKLKKRQFGVVVIVGHDVAACRCGRRWFGSSGCGTLVSSTEYILFLFFFPILIYNYKLVYNDYESTTPYNNGN